MLYKILDFVNKKNQTHLYTKWCLWNNSLLPILVKQLNFIWETILITQCSIVPTQRIIQPIKFISLRMLHLILILFCQNLSIFGQ